MTERRLALFGTDGVRGTANVYPTTAEMALALGQANAVQNDLLWHRLFKVQALAYGAGGGEEGVRHFQVVNTHGWFPPG